MSTVEPILVAHWYLGPVRDNAAAETREAAARAARRRGAPEMVHAHAFGEPCGFGCIGLLPGPH